MNISVQRQNHAFTNQFSFYANYGLKSTEEKQKRQMKCEQEIGFWENRKENLKTMECDTLEEISRKLELLHTYEEEINAAKAAYNNEQMWHIMDEARELGEKIAEAAEEQKTKTKEEREEEKRKEALGTEETEGALSELLDEMDELTEELQEEWNEELLDEANANPEELEAELAKQESVSIDNQDSQMEQEILADEQDLQAEQEKDLTDGQNLQAEQEKDLTDGQNLQMEQEYTLAEEQNLQLEMQKMQTERRMVSKEYALQAYKRFDIGTEW